MSMTIPTIPVLSAGYVVQLADLQNLAYACTFALTKPETRIIDATGGQTIPASLSTALTFTSASFDTDGMWNVSSPDRLTVQTPGWYKLRYGVNCGNVSGSFVTTARSTTGSNNPAGAGVQSAAYWGGYSDSAGGANGWGYAAGAGIWPFYLYAGDYIQLFVWANTTGFTTGTGSPGSATQAYTNLSLEYVSIT